MFKNYCVWYRGFSDENWKLSYHTLKARTDKEAQSKLKKFSGCGFSSMSMLAIQAGKSPNEV